MTKKGTLVADSPAVINKWRLPDEVRVQGLDSDGKLVTLAALSRPALKITIQHGGKQVDLIDAHLKSKLLEFPRGAFSTKDESLRAKVAYFALQRRAAEALTIREHATDLLKRKRHVIVLGDLNDGAQAATTQILYGPPGSQPKGPDDAADKNSGFNRGDEGDAERLFNVVLLVDPAHRWTRKFEGQNELIDHVLVSASLMLPRKVGLFAAPDVEIRNADATMRTKQPVTDGVVPDHAPVTVQFK